MPDFIPLTPERADEIRRAMQESRGKDRGIAIDLASGRCAGAVSVRQAPDTKVNVIGKYDTHYSERAMGLLNDPKRLVLEEMAMRERWGNEPTLCQGSDQRLLWDCTLKIEANEFRVWIIYPRDYPASPPEIIPVTDLPANTPHRLDGGRLCWYRPGAARGNNVWDPAHDSAALAVGVAYRWFLAFLVWMTTREWPVPDAANTE